MEQTWQSIIPFFIVIFMAFCIKDILLGLILGLLIGSIFVADDIFEGIQQSITYMIITLSNETNINILSFLYLFGGLIGMINITGGMKGFSEWVGQKITSERKLLSFLWLTLPITFMMPMFRIMMLAPLMKSLVKKIHVSKEKVGMILDISTESVIVLLPVATAFVGFMISLVEAGMQDLRFSMSPYELFLLSILFNFYAFIMLLIGLLKTFFPTKNKLYESAKKKETIELRDNHFHRMGIKKELSFVKAQPWNLILPVCLLLCLTLYLLWENGKSLGAQTVFEAFSIADATFVMLLAVFITLLLTFIFYIIRKQPLHELIFHFYDGGNQMMQAISLLLLIWALTLAVEDLHFSMFAKATVGLIMPAFLTPAIIFIIGSIVGYFIGSSWGTWGIFMPLGMTLAASTGASIPLTIGAVFASGAFGAISSPLGDTTITTASILDLDLVDYARYKLKLSIIGAAISVFCYLIAGWLLL